MKNSNAVYSIYVEKAGWVRKDIFPNYK